MRIVEAVLGCAVLLIAAANQNEEPPCFSSALCLKGNIGEKTHLQISPRPKCTGGTPNKKNTQIYQTSVKFNTTIANFFKDLKNVTKEKCAVNIPEAFRDPDHSYEDNVYCYAPVSCIIGAETELDYIQIIPAPLCEDSKEKDQMFSEMEFLFNKSRNLTVKELDNVLLKNCDICRSEKFDEIVKNLQKLTWKSVNETRECFAPVICSEDKASVLNWKRYPSRGCKLSTAMLLSKRPDVIFSSILQDTLQEIEKEIELSCGKASNEETSLATPTQDFTEVTNVLGNTTVLDGEQPETTSRIEEKITKAPETSSEGSTVKQAENISEPNMSTSRAKLPPSNWYRASNGLYYKFFDNETVNYETAKARCAVFGGRLAATGMRSAEIRKEIRKILPNPFRTGTNIWIGLDDLITKRNFIWSDGEESTRANTDWEYREPNNHAQACGALYRKYNGLVVDLMCSYELYYLCEF